MIRLSRARLAQFIAALAVLIGALTLTPGSAQAASVNGAFSNTVVTAASGPGPIHSSEQISVPADWKVPDSTPAGTTSSLGWSVAQPESIGDTLPLKNMVGGIVANCLPVVKHLVSVGDFVWWDVNRDGLQSAGEPGISGVTVTLQDSGGNVVATIQTDASGYYAFPGLTPGQEYAVVFTPPEGAEFTTPNVGTNDAIDSDAPASGKVTLTKSVTSAGPYYGGANVTYKLVPHNDGSVATLAGWSVTDVLPAGMTLVSISGDGYTCDATTDPTKPVCVAGAGLGARADGAVITVVTKVTIDYGSLKNVAYVSPAKGDVPETNPLVIPTLATDTSKKDDKK